MRTLPWSHQAAAPESPREIYSTSLPGLVSGMSPEEFLALAGPGIRHGVYAPRTWRVVPEKSSDDFPAANFLVLAAWPVQVGDQTGVLMPSFLDRRLLGFSFFADDGNVMLEEWPKGKPYGPFEMPEGLGPLLTGSGQRDPYSSTKREAFRDKLIETEGLLKQKEGVWTELRNGTWACEWESGEFWFEDPQMSARLHPEFWHRYNAPRILFRGN